MSYDGRDAEVDQVEAGVVGALVPDRSAAPSIQRQAVPAVAAGLVGAGDRVESPHLLTRLDVHADDEAAAWRKARRHALDDLVADDERRAPYLIAASRRRLTGRCDLVVPDERASPRVQGHDVEIGRRHEHPVAAQRQTHLLARRHGRRVLIPPQDLAVRGVQREHRIRDRLQEHDAVVDERSRHAEAGAKRHPPRRLELLHVVARDQFQRAEIVAVVRASPLQPVPVGRVPQHAVRDGAQPGQPRGSTRRRHDRRRWRIRCRPFTTRDRHRRECVGIGGQRLGRGLLAVGLQKVGKDARVDIVGEPSWFATQVWRHAAQVKHQRTGCPPAPRPIEPLAAEGWCQVLALELGAVTGRAVLLVGRSAGGRLRRRERRALRSDQLTEEDSHARTERNGTTATDPGPFRRFHEHPSSQRMCVSLPDETERRGKRSSIESFSF